MPETVVFVGQDFTYMVKNLINQIIFVDSLKKVNYKRLSVRDEQISSKKLHLYGGIYEVLLKSGPGRFEIHPALIL
jgi:hypothetical protein